jgi:hypothetical protein
MSLVCSPLLGVADLASGGRSFAAVGLGTRGLLNGGSVPGVDCVRGAEYQRLATPLVCHATTTGLGDFASVSSTRTLASTADLCRPTPGAVLVVFPLDDTIGLTAGLSATDGASASVTNPTNGDRGASGILGGQTRFYQRFSWG